MGEVPRSPPFRLRFLLGLFLLLLFRFSLLVTLGRVGILLRFRLRLGLGPRLGLGFHRLVPTRVHVAAAATVIAGRLV